MLPEACPLLGRSAPHLLYVFVGDKAFPLQRNLMRPCHGQLISIDRGICHDWLSRACPCCGKSFRINGLHSVAFTGR